MRNPAMRNLIALAAATTLAGCVNMAPKHERPPLSTAADYPAEFAGDVTLGQRATDVAWRDFFADPQLEVLIEQAITRNRDPGVAVAKLQEAPGQLGEGACGGQMVHLVERPVSAV